MSSQSVSLLDHIRAGLVGSNTTIEGPFGPRPLIYADYTASGRALDFVERALADKVLPLYANTHTETSCTSAQTTRFREEAREAIRSAVGATRQHAVVFAGSGATGAIALLADAMDLRNKGSDTIVFVGPYEHHSNDLIWRESGASVVRIPLNEAGHICFDTLERELAIHADASLKIGAFSAASNVTGIVTDMQRLSTLLHNHGSLLVADYAAGGPYLPIDMIGDGIDAIFLSPHKFVGGPGASGVLVADRNLLRGPVPTVPGGGTVSFVSASVQRYVSDEEQRQEAGTPNILGDIRAGMVLQLKADIGAATIAAAEHAAVSRALAAWRNEPNIEVLGPDDADRLAIFSFNIRHGERYLHPNFVVALLNDLFGIQARGGCSCAGPYGHDLLHINPEKSARYDGFIQQGLAAFRPGWARLGFNYFFDDATIDSIIAAVSFVARRGADFLPLYEPDPHTGQWLANETSVPVQHGFAELCQWGKASLAEPSGGPDFDDVLTEAATLADQARGIAGGPCDAALARDDRWFSVAGDIAD